MPVMGVDWGAVQGIAQSLEAIGLLATLIFLGRQFRLQKEELTANRQAVDFQTYQQISQRYSEILLMASEDPELNCIWDPLDPDRREELDAAQAAKLWGAWDVMTLTERKCYRYIRTAFETFEQAHEVYCQGTLPADTWKKWRAWIEIWISTRYYPYAIEDAKPRFVPRFLDLIEQLERELGRPAGASLLAPAESGDPE
jgi:hypothetical protein